MTTKTALPVRADKRLVLDPNAEGADLLGVVVDFYHRKLFDHQAALDYLAGRGIANQDAIHTFRIGWADRDLGRALPSKSVKAGRAIRSRLTELGIYRQSGHAHFNGCMVFPVVDEKNQVREIYGRKIHHNLSKLYQLNYDPQQDGQPGDPTTGLIDVDAFESMRTTNEVQV